MRKNHVEEALCFLRILELGDQSCLSLHVNQSRPDALSPIGVRENLNVSGQSVSSPGLLHSFLLWPSTFTAMVTNSEEDQPERSAASNCSRRLEQRFVRTISASATEQMSPRAKRNWSVPEHLSIAHWSLTLLRLTSKKFKLKATQVSARDSGNL